MDMCPRERSGRSSSWSLWKCDPRCKAWEGCHLGDCGQGLGRGLSPETVDVTPGSGSRERFHPGYY